MQIPPLLLDRSRGEPLTAQLVGQLRDAIRQGRIPVGARLPSSRRLSEQLYVARNTVVRAYETLTMEGYVETRSASGVFAAASQPVAPPASVTLATTGSVADAAHEMPLPRAQPGAQKLLVQNRHRLNFDFLPGRPRASLFPVKVWRRLLQGCLSYGGGAGLTQYGDPGGLPALRAAIATHLAFSRGVVVDPGQVLIVAGVQEGLNIATRLFVSPGDRLLVEDPCYAGAARAFEAAGAQLHGVPVDEDGIDTRLLPEGPSPLLYLTPSHQYPTGHVLSLARRHELIAWARRSGCYLLEDDCDSEFHYEGSPLPAVASLAPDCCIYLGSFSKSLGAGLRIGYMVVPPRLVDAVREAKTLLNNGNPWLDQAALAEFIRGGSFAAHLTRCRADYKESRDALTGALRRHFGDVRLSGERSGLHLFWQLPAGVPEATRLEELARQSRVGVYSLASSNGHWGAASAALARRGIVLGYATMQPKQIEQAVARLSDVVDDTLDCQPGFVEELLQNAPPPRPLSSVAADQHGRRPARPVPPILQQPALRTVMSRRSQWRNDTPDEKDLSMRLIRGIYRYPVKGLSPQALRGIELEAGKPFPFDRIFALARPGVPIDVAEPAWAKKGLFVMLMLDEALAQVRTRLDVSTLQFEILRHGEKVLSADLQTASGRAAVESFFKTLVPRLEAPPRLVQASSGHFMDKPDNVVSLINLATVRSLEAKWGRPVDPLRFRANFYIDGLRPWEEFDWIGSDILLGDALLRVDRRNGRCGATNVNPTSGQRDMDIPSALRQDFGHKDLGIYLIVRKAGKVVVGDPVEVPQFDSTAAPETFTPAVIAPGPRRHICRGCYFIHDEATGTPFSDIAPSWRCPDCGSDKSMFRAYTGE
ncbi:MAG: aminotransferase class I/II-fold pyridoxal phosphate-dependent enzyme [Pseudomonadota bacterium]